MKKILLFIAMITMIATSSTFAQKGFKITGHIQGLENGKKVTLTLGATHNDEKPMYNAIVTNGIFTFTGKLEGARLFNLQVEGLMGGAPFFVENATINITGKISIKKEDESVFAVFSNILVEGSKSHDFYQAHGSKVREINNKAYEAYHEKHKLIFDSISKFERGSTEYKRLEQTDAYKKFADDETTFFNNIKETYNKTVSENSNSFWGPFFMLEGTGYLTEEQKPQFEAMSDEAKNSFYGKLVKAELFPITLMGKAAPKFTEANRDGKKFSLDGLMGKYTIIDFWASWCAPCRKEIPNLKSLYEKYQSKGLAIISISIDKENAKWKKALDEEQLTWANLIDNGGVANEYGVKAIPDMFIVDEKGKVIAIKLRGEGLVEKLKELFGE